MIKYTIENIKEKGLIIFSAIMGSKAYGTSLPTSDTDIRGVFIQPIEDILSFGYVEQVSDETNDITYYEIQRFLELVQTNNPNILELLNAPEDMILLKDPIFDLVLDQKEAFISKQCKMSFAGYAIGQIKKARGYNKKINWEENEMVRKGPLDFCYVMQNGGSIKFEDWMPQKIEILDQSGEILKEYSPVIQEHYGLANIDHAHDVYALYFIGDEGHGIVSGPGAFDVHLSSIPKGIKPAGYLTFNKDGYSSHCKKYKEYTEWLENRNEDRFKMNKEHGKQYDSKNLAHCIRLLNMGIEIAITKNIIVRRPPEDIELLMSIRRGEMEYDDILSMADKKIKLLDEVYEKSNLPNNVDTEFVNNLLIIIRKIRYNLQ